MKKIQITMMVIFTVLFSCIFLTGCDPDNNSDNGKTVHAQGKLVILQAYGNAGDGSPEGISHSFVELYNISDETINLEGIGLYFANGTSVAAADAPNTATQDEQWKRIALSGTIPAGSSFLVLGAKHDNINSTHFIIPDNYGDKNDPELILSRRGFKVALIESTADLTVQNPFDININGAKSPGYIDMLGTANDYQGRDLIFGFEAAPARNSASEAVRRQDDWDSDNNSMDFISIRYRATGSPTENAKGDPGVLIGTEDWVLEHYRPKNLAHGTWDPFTNPEEPQPENPTQPGELDILAGKLLILQAFGSSSDANGVSHSFVELYNNTELEINLDGITLYYADGVDNGNNAQFFAHRDGPWKMLDLNGYSIPAKTSFLILGPHQGSSIAHYTIPVDSGDINDNAFILSNRAFKVALIRSDKPLTVQNPSDIDSQKAAGYIDLVGSANEYQTRDTIFGFEAAPARNSASEAIRLGSATRTGNNSVDYVGIRYRSSGSPPPGGAMANPAWRLDHYKPKNIAHGAWDPFAEPQEPVVTEGTPRLMILQANSIGNDNGGGGGFARALVELYNNTDTPINLTTGNYYIHIGDNSAWTVVIKLEGIVNAKHSFLIVDNTTPTTTGNSGNLNETPRAVLPVPDQEASFYINPGSFKVALMRNQSTTLIFDNPFNESSLTADYVDMLGTGNTSETQAASASRPQGPRRTSLTDTDNNSADFAQADYRGGRLSDSELYKVWPRNSSMGQWNPITGLPQMNPALP